MSWAARRSTPCAKSSHLVAKLTGRRRWIVGLPDAVARMQALAMDFVPGRPFSSDNYRSLDRRQRVHRGRLRKARHQAAIDAGIRAPIFGCFRRQRAPQPQPRQRRPQQSRPAVAPPAQRSNMHRLRKPYLLFLGDVQRQAHGEDRVRPQGLVRRRTCVGEWSLPGCSVTLGLERAFAPAGRRARRRFHHRRNCTDRRQACRRIGSPNWRRRPMPDSTS